MIKALKDFVCVAQDTGYTQTRRSHDELWRFFWKVAKQADFGSQRDTVQGHFAFDATGRLYGYRNDRDVEGLLEMLNDAKARFEKKPPAKLKLPFVELETQPKAPEDALIARVFSRILPLPDGADPLNRSLGRDFLWILDAEVQDLLQGRFPASLCARLARFHLCDNIRGQPDPWIPGHVKKADFSAEVTRSPKLTRVTFQGAFRMSAPKGKRGAGIRRLPETGFEGTLKGDLLYDESKGKATQFRMHAQGEAWGESTYTPDPPEGRFPLRIAIMLAEDDVAREIAPQGVSWTSLEEYLAPRLK